MKDNVEIGRLTKLDSFRLNRDQVMDLETWFKIHTNASNFRLSLKTIQTLYYYFFFLVNSVIFLTMSKRIDFHLSYFQIVGGFRDFTVVRKLNNSF